MAGGNIGPSKSSTCPCRLHPHSRVGVVLTSLRMGTVSIDSGPNTDIIIIEMNIASCTTTTPMLQSQGPSHPS